MGASVIITGLSPEIAQTLVTIGVDLSKMNTIGDLQGGLEEAERLLGYTRDPAGGGGASYVDTGPALVSILRQGRQPDRVDPHCPGRLADGAVPAAT